MSLRCWLVGIILFDAYGCAVSYVGCRWVFLGIVVRGGKGTGRAVR